MRSRLRHVRRHSVDGFEQLLDVLVQPLEAARRVFTGGRGLGCLRFEYFFGRR